MSREDRLDFIHGYTTGFSTAASTAFQAMASRWRGFLATCAAVKAEREGKRYLELENSSTGTEEVPPEQ